jgi:hypothetical protein
MVEAYPSSAEAMSMLESYAANCKVSFSKTKSKATTALGKLQELEKSYSHLNKDFLFAANLGLHFVKLADDKAQAEQALRELNQVLEAKLAAKTAQCNETAVSLATAQESMRQNAENALQAVKDREEASRMKTEAEGLLERAKEEAVRTYETGVKGRVFGESAIGLEELAVQAKKKAEQLAKTVLSLEKRRREVEQEGTRARSEAEELKETVTSLRIQLGSSQDELEATSTLSQEALASALKEQEQLRLTVERLTDELKELTSVRAVLTEKVIAVSAQLTATAQDFEEAKGEIHHRDQETAGLKAAVAALTLETAEFSTKAAEWAEVTGHLQRTIEQRDQQLSELSGAAAEVALLKSDKGQLVEENLDLRRTIDGLRSQLDATTAQLRTSEAELSKKSIEYSALEGALLKQTEQVNRMQPKVQELARLQDLQQRRRLDSVLEEWLDLQPCTKHSKACDVKRPEMTLERLQVHCAVQAPRLSQCTSTELTLSISCVQVACIEARCAPEEAKCAELPQTRVPCALQIEQFIQCCNQPKKQAEAACQASVCLQISSRPSCQVKPVLKISAASQSDSVVSGLNSTSSGRPSVLSLSTHIISDISSAKQDLSKLLVCKSASISIVPTTPKCTLGVSLLNSADTSVSSAPGTPLGRRNTYRTYTRKEPMQEFFILVRLTQTYQSIKLNDSNRDHLNYIPVEDLYESALAQGVPFNQVSSRQWHEWISVQMKQIVFRRSMSRLHEA